MKRLCQSDRISSLPADVILHILMFLDLKDAAKTSILSRKWRHYWKKIPKLVFDDYFAEESEQYDMNKILLDIYKILLLHDGPITKFVLSINGLMPCDDIDPIIRYVSEKGVQHLSLSFVKDGDASGLKISSSLFYAVQLNHLALEGGVFVSPSWFVGFNRLKVLEFNLVKLPHDIFERFIPMCPLLEDLTVSYSGPCPEPVLVAPRLKVFVFEEYLDNIVFKCTPLLAVVSIQLTNESFIKGKEGPDMVALFASLPALQQLYVNLHFLNYLGASEHVPHKLPTVLSHLRLLSIHEGWEYMDELETKVLFCLLKSSPRLHRIILSTSCVEPIIPKEAKLVELESVEYLEAEEEEEDIGLECLKEVHFQDCKGSQWEMLVLRFVLETVHRLEKIVIQPSETMSEGRLELVKEEVSGYKPTSSQAKFIYL